MFVGVVYSQLQDLYYVFAAQDGVETVSPPRTFLSTASSADMIERQNDRRHVAWDLETTGFGWDDEITVSGFWFPGGHTELIVNTGGEALGCGDVEDELEEVSGGVSVSVTVTDD